MLKKYIVGLLLMSAVACYATDTAQAATKFAVQIIWQIPLNCYIESGGKQVDASNFFQYMFSVEPATAMNVTYGSLTNDYYTLMGQSKNSTVNMTKNYFNSQMAFNQYVVGPYFTHGADVTQNVFITKPQFPKNNGSFTAASIRAAFIGLYDTASNAKYSGFAQAAKSLAICLENGPLGYGVESTLSGATQSCSTAVSTVVSNVPNVFKTSNNVFTEYAEINLEKCLPVQGVAMQPNTYFGSTIVFRLHLITPGKQIKLDGATSIKDIVQLQNTYTDMVADVESNGWGF